MPIYTIQDIAYKIINFKERPSNLIFPIRLHNLLYLVLIEHYKKLHNFLFYSDIIKTDTGVVFSALDDKNNLSLNAIGQIVKLNNYVPNNFNLPNNQKYMIEEHFLNILLSDEGIIEDTLKKYNIDDYHLVETVKKDYSWKNTSTNKISYELIQTFIQMYEIPFPTAVAVNS